MTNTKNRIPFNANFPIPDDVKDAAFNSTAAVGTPTLIATATVPAGQLWVLRYIHCRMRDQAAVNDLYVLFTIVRLGVSTQIRYEAIINDNCNYDCMLQIPMQAGDTITVTAINNTAAAQACSAAYLIDVFNL